MIDKMKKLPTFWRIYSLVAIFLVLVVAIGLIVLNSYLEAFEAAQPIHAAEEAFQRYFATGDFKQVREKSEVKVSEFESISSANEKFLSLCEGKEMDFYSISAKGDEASYNVVLIEDGKAEEGKAIPSTKIATINLKKSEKKTAFGFSGFEFKNAEILVKAEESVRVSLPSEYRLLVNGKEASENYLAATSDHEWNSYLPDGVAGIEMAEYEIKELFLEPTLSVQDAEGNEIELVFDEENSIYRAGLKFETEVDPALSNRILSGMKEYAAYIQNDGSIGKVAPYFDTASMFYRNTALNPSVFVWDHNGYLFRDEAIEDFYFFDEKTLCCHVSFDQVLKKYGSEDYVDRIDMTVFVRKIGSTWRIYDRIVR